MSIMVTAKVKPEHVGDLETAAQRMFAALQREQVAGVRYASYRLPDGVTFVAVLQLEDGVENPLAAVPEFGAFQEGLKGWMDGPPSVAQLTVVGSYVSF